MKTLTAICTAIILTHSATGRELAADEAAALEKRFLSAQKNTRTLQADFKQIITAPGLRDSAASTGRLLYQAPDNLLVTYTEPAGDYLLLRGDKFTSLRAGKSTTRDAADPSARALTALRDILRGAPPGSVMARSVTQSGGKYIVTLTPAVPGLNQPQRIENLLETSTLQLQSMTITLPRGATMQFIFSRIRRNAALDPKAFDLP
jgi:outer membrane lipoprotein-sorting protein